MISAESIINSLEETLILFDKKSKVVYVNKAGEELLRKSAKDIIGKRISQIIPGKGTISALVKKTLRDGRSFKGKSESLNIGQILNVDFSISPFFINDRIEGTLLSMSQSLNIADREDYDFDSAVYLLGSIAHEIKNPLGGIKGAAQLLRNNTQNVCIDEYVGLIIKETDRLNSLLQDYLTVCKKPSFNMVNIHEVIEQALAILSIPMQKAGITLKRIYDPSLPYIRGDESKLLQVCLNIVKNAIESMKKGGSLEISTGPAGELFKERGRIKRMALLKIKDTGKGIEEKDLQKIFLPLYTKKKKGTGIGLAFSKKSVKDHGGFIKVKSQKNRGTCFHIYLPYEHVGKKDSIN
jgi:two-component system nitrogen regulation sensor histidine kinase GlnL